VSIIALEFLPRNATQSAVLPWEVVCPSAYPSVCKAGGLWSHTLS